MRPPPDIVVASAPTPSLVSTVPFPSDRDRAEPLGAPFLLPNPPGTPSAARTDLDYHGTAAELQFGDYAGRYSYTEWERQ